ncbi:uncharacterized protein [Physcomitrium patens]|uniref:Uncharacterized protein n=2 Tax=Physcomitrium patens TaxID=3218 RepID=A0A7I4CP41_PHYPA
MAKKGKKNKLPPYWNEERDSAPFENLKAWSSALARDLIKTPLGLVGTILGVKYETKEQGKPGSGTMWVRYPNMFISPLVKNLTGYKRLSDGDHIWRDLKEFNEVKEEREEVRAIIDAANDKYVGELIAEWEKNKRGKEKKKEP